MDAGVSCAGRSLCWVPTYTPEYMHVCVCVHLTDLGACSPLSLSRSLSLAVESLLLNYMRIHARE